jgi:hypothetical protein
VYEWTMIRKCNPKINKKLKTGVGIFTTAQKNQAYGMRFNRILYCVRHIFGRFELKATGKEQSISVTYVFMTSLQDT